MTAARSTRSGRRRSISDLFSYHHGLHYKSSLLWFDAATPRALSFVSHALVSGAYRHQKIVTTDATAELLRTMANLYGRGRHAHEPQILVTPYGRPFSLGPLKLELIPTGYVLGAASLKVRHRNRTIIYAGQINPAGSDERLVHQLQSEPCDILVLPCGFNAHQRLALPEPKRIRRQLLRFVETTIENGETPVLLCPALGEAQQLVSLLQQRGTWSLRLHRQIYALSKVYARRSPTPLDLSRVHRHVGPILPKDQQVLIWPSRLYASRALAKLENTRVALVSAAAQNRQLRRQMNCDTGFSLSSQADYSGLLSYVRSCTPSAVVLTGDPSQELAEDLRALGLEVYMVGPERQLDLF